MHRPTVIQRLEPNRRIKRPDSKLGTLHSLRIVNTVEPRVEHELVIKIDEQELAHILERGTRRTFELIETDLGMLKHSTQHELLTSASRRLPTVLQPTSDHRQAHIEPPKHTIVILIVISS